ncbi:hypothetical protein [Formosa sp. S-31]|uniref:hypothetical protein n=1 Tax=Formosa sp. S-31 TaxID=2790949 RepID=UPI003EBFAD51
MDELELLKKDWKKQGNNDFPKLSYNDIYKMLLKKSSSIVKWIFIISILEFLFWTLISFSFKDYDAFDQFKTTDAKYLLIGLSVIGYIVLFYFFYRFYKNYKTISVTDNAKRLMENILRTRQTVKHYVAFNLIFLALSTVSLLFIEFQQDKALIAKVDHAAANGNALLLYAKVILITGLGLAIVIGLLLGFYWLIYGLLIKKLDRNYKELKRMEL